MKKLVLTAFLASTFVTGFAMNAEAAEEKSNAIESYKLYAKVHALQLSDKEIENAFKEVMKLYNVKLPTELQLKEIFQEMIEKKAKETLQKEKVEQPKVKKEEKQQQPSNKQKEEKKQQQPSTEQKVEKKPVVTPPAETAKGNEQQKEEQQQTSVVSQEEQQMIDLANEERAKVGLAPLKVNNDLTKVARVKAQDMISNNYFAHQSPTYGSPFDMLNQFGITYRTAGENLAGNQTVEAAHRALMNSDGHRANILGQNYTEVGIGIVNGGPYGKMFVQLFKG